MMITDQELVDLRNLVSTLETFMGISIVVHIMSTTFIIAFIVGGALD
jgi:hypothetical protein